ncbi:hypothetical protein BLNAU_382 [Blattamonas nauphoetae]|uniref:Uncharacterized protein n=1 Tax=Blattamonas nauphoetae TaxID=2049346 RepID=A0ABQ9YL35_9EUKA|nr:hypothetical protein BLNAU_382 [Blattamonas nauphoetae]
MSQTARRKNKQVNSLSFESEIVDFSYCSESSESLVSMMDGTVAIFDRNLSTRNIPHFVDSCLYPSEHTIRFSKYLQDHHSVLVGGSGKQSYIIDSREGLSKSDDPDNEHSINAQLTFSHEEGLSVALLLGENHIAFGGEDGMISIWDTRMAKASFRKKDRTHEEYITSISVSPSGSRLAFTSEDGCFSIINTKTLEHSHFITCSQDLEAGLTSSVFFHHARTSAVTFEKSDIEWEPSLCLCLGNTPLESLLFFRDGEYGSTPFTTVKHSRSKTHPSAANVLVRWNDEIILSGGTDGAIRAMTLFPYEELLFVGDHKGGMDGCQGIEISPDRSEIASYALTKKLKFWSTKALLESEPSASDMSDSEDEESESLENSSNSLGDSSDSVSEEMTSDSEEDSDESPSPPPQKQKRTVSGSYSQRTQQVKPRKNRKGKAQKGVSKMQRFLSQL